MLRKCIKEMNDSDSDGDNINVQVSCACCGGTVKESNIDQTDDNADDASAAAAAANDINKNEKHEESSIAVERRRKTIKRNLLRSKQSCCSKFTRCFGCCCKSIGKKDKRMVKETGDLHASQESAKDISRSQVLC